MLEIFNLFQDSIDASGAKEEFPLEEFVEEYEKVPVEHYPHNAPNDPVVSVCVQTYQQADYIEECLESILMQETDFPYEILVGEDESTDGTREICREYAEKYPDKIRLFLHSRENNIERAGLPTSRFNTLYNFYQARGKYIALCEGDDYWTDADKLQLQKEFMEENEDCSMCFHAANIISEKSIKKSKIFYSKYFREIEKLDLNNVIKLSDKFIIVTSSMFFPTRKIKLVPKWLLNAPVGDLPLILLLGSLGEVSYLGEFMSVYRKGVQGSWNESSKNLDKREEFRIGKIILWRHFDVWTNFEYHKLLTKKKRSDFYGYLKAKGISLLKRVGFYKFLKYQINRFYNF